MLKKLDFVWIFQINDLTLHSQKRIRCHVRVVRYRSAKPFTAVRVCLAPPFKSPFKRTFFILHSSFIQKSYSDNTLRWEITKSRTYCSTWAASFSFRIRQKPCAASVLSASTQTSIWAYTVRRIFSLILKRV